MIKYCVKIVDYRASDYGQPYPGATGKVVEVSSNNAQLLKFAQTFPGVQKVESMESDVIHLQVEGDVGDFEKRLKKALNDKAQTLED